jgi:hypothetical protein
MTEEEVPASTSECSKEISFELMDYRFTIRCSNWLDALTQIGVGKLKSRIAMIAANELECEPASRSWLLAIPKSAGKIVERIALALLLVFPASVSRTRLSIISSVKLGSLANYLTKSELGVQPHIIEDENGIVLNHAGYEWALEILHEVERKEGDSPD